MKIPVPEFVEIVGLPSVPRYLTVQKALLFFGIVVSGGIMAYLTNPRFEGSLPPPWFGLAERVNAYGFMLWMLAPAIILLHVTSSSFADREITIDPDMAVNCV